MRVYIPLIASYDQSLDSAELEAIYLVWTQDSDITQTMPVKELALQKRIHAAGGNNYKHARRNSAATELREACGCM